MYDTVMERQVPVLLRVVLWHGHVASRGEMPAQWIGSRWLMRCMQLYSNIVPWS